MVRVWWQTWPNSWKRVSTSSWESSGGRPPLDGLKLAISTEMGAWYFPSSNRATLTAALAAWPYFPSRGYRSA